MTHVFIVTSTIKPKIGVIDSDERYLQSLNTLESIRNKVPDSFILMVDSSPDPLTEEQYHTLAKQCNQLISLTGHPQSDHLSSIGAKSLAETFVMMVAIDYLINNPLDNIGRVFKLTGRGELTDDFDINYYNDVKMQNHYIFKQSVVSWRDPSQKLVDTRIWSFCYSQLSEIQELLPKVFEMCNNTGLDVEHSYYALIDKTRLIEKNLMGFKCQISSTGVWQYD